MHEILKNRTVQLIALVAAAAIAMWCFGVIGKAKAADKGGPKKQVAAVVDDDLPPPPSWTGIYLGIHGGPSTANAEVSGFGGSIDGLGAHGTVGGGTLGARWHVPSSPLVVGGRLNYTFGETEFNVSPAIFRAAIKESWSGDGVVGLALGTAMPYGFFGYTKAETEASAGGKALKGVPDLEGYRYGAGVEFRLPKLDATPVISTMALEYVRTDYDKLTFGSGLSAVGVDVTGQAFMGRLNVQFGGR